MGEIDEIRYEEQRTTRFCVYAGAAVLVVLILSLGSCGIKDRMNEAAAIEAITKMVNNGKSPSAARCAIFGRVIDCAAAGK